MILILVIVSLIVIAVTRSHKLEEFEEQAIDFSGIGKIEDKR